MAATRVYLPVDSLQVYIDYGTVTPQPYTASHLRIYPDYVNSFISIKDELLSDNWVINLIYSDIKDSAGAQAGATMEDTVLYLSKIMG